MDYRRSSPSWTLWTTTLVVVVLSLFMGLIQWVGMAEMAARATSSSPWWSIAAYAILPWLPWFLVAPGVAFLALRYRIGLGHTGRHVAVHMMAGMLFASLAALLLHWAEPMLAARIGWPCFIMNEVEFPADQGMFTTESGVLEAREMPPEFMALMIEYWQGSGSPERDETIIEGMNNARLTVAPILSGLITYSVFIAIINALLFYRDLRSREATAIRLEAELVRTQLQTLRGQLQPHFLFNTLNSIKTLMASDAETAEHVITRFADLLRASLSDLQENEVALSQELAFIGNYLEIEQIRFGSDLQIVFDIAPGTEHAIVPVFCLQPLVENAVKHGVGRRESLGVIRISAARSGSSLQIEVADDGPGLPPDMTAPIPGIGLENTRTRIEHLYGQRGSMDIDAPPGGGFTVRLQLPYQEVTDRSPELHTNE